MDSKNTRIAILGLGCVGLPVAVAFGRLAPGTIAFDVDNQRIVEIERGIDRYGELSEEQIRQADLRLTVDTTILRNANVFIVCVPTPLRDDKTPNLAPLVHASEIVARALTKGALVIYESTVYPGATDEVCAQILARDSGLTRGTDFKVGYAPERINPGDKAHTFERICKVVAGEDEDALDRVAELYSKVVKAGVHRAPSIEVAEIAKLLENVQRDLNIALINEIAIICDRMGIRTRDVLDAATTKWNFLNFSPGLVGGHCISIAPYYLAAKSLQLGYQPGIVLSGRRVNDSMSIVVAQKIVQLLSQCPRPLNQMRVGVLGLTFKENVADIRDSRVPDVLYELKQFGMRALVHDPIANSSRVREEYGFVLDDIGTFVDLDAVVLAVPHQQYLNEIDKVYAMLRKDGLLADIKSALTPESVPTSLRYWSL